MKIAVYTAIFNNYDIIQQPFFIPLEVDFFCFTNDQTYVSHPWKYISHKIPENSNAKIESARLKILSHEILASYDYTVWVDGNIIIKRNIYELILSLNKNYSFWVNRHLSRDCIYDEALVCIKEFKADKNKTNSQIQKYKKLGFPEKYGLYETTVIIRSQKNNDLNELHKIWWHEFYNGGHRDQLALDFSRWKTNIQFDVIGYDYRNSSYFYKLPHIPNVMKKKLYYWDTIARLYYSENLFCKILIKLLLFFIYISP